MDRTMHPSDRRINTENRRKHRLEQTAEPGRGKNHFKKQEQLENLEFREDERNIIGFKRGCLTEKSSHQSGNPSHDRPTQRSIARYQNMSVEQPEERLELTDALAQIEEMREQLAATHTKCQSAQRELACANTELVTNQRSHAEQVAKLEEQIEKLTEQLRVAQSRSIKEAAAEIREIEQAESEELHRSVRELRNEVGWLKYLSTSLKETCNALKQELAVRKDAESELAKARTEIIKLQKELAVCRKSGEQPQDSGLEDSSCEYFVQDNTNKYRRRIRALKLENRRLYLLVDQLRLQLSRTDSVYQSDYYFVTGV